MKKNSPLRSKFSDSILGKWLWWSGLFLLGIGFTIYAETTYQNVSVNIPEKIAGDTVSAQEFNQLTGVLRGVQNYQISDDQHQWGIGKKWQTVADPLARIGIDLQYALGLAPMSGTVPTCTENLAGTLFYGQNGADTDFWYCNGSDWGVIGGITGGGSDPDNHDDECNVQAITGQVTETEKDNYETRCDGQNVWWYDMCGDEYGYAPYKTCSTSQTCIEQETGKDLHKYTDPLTDKILNISPYHQDCEGSKCKNPRRTKRYEATCVSATNAPQCGTANGQKFAGIPNNGLLCAKGTPSAVSRGWIGDVNGPKQYQWTCQLGGNSVSCSADDYHYEPQPWSACENGSQSRKINCCHGNSCTPNMKNCTGTLSSNGNVATLPTTEQSCVAEFGCGPANGKYYAVPPADGDLCQGGVVKNKSWSAFSFELFHPEFVVDYTWECEKDGDPTVVKNCKADHYEWYVGPWGVCNEGQQERVVCCAGDQICLINDSQCRNVIGLEPKPNTIQTPCESICGSLAGVISPSSPAGHQVFMDNPHPPIPPAPDDGTISIDVNGNMHFCKERGQCLTAQYELSTDTQPGLCEKGAEASLMYDGWKMDGGWTPDTGWVTGAPNSWWWMCIKRRNGNREIEQYEVCTAPHYEWRLGGWSNPSCRTTCANGNQGCSAGGILIPQNGKGIQTRTVRCCNGPNDNHCKNLTSSWNDNPNKFKFNEEILNCWGKDMRFATGELDIDEIVDFKTLIGIGNMDITTINNNVANLCNVFHLPKDCSINNPAFGQYLCEKVGLPNCPFLGRNWFTNSPRDYIPDTEQYCNAGGGTPTDLNNVVND